MEENNWSTWQNDLEFDAWAYYDWNNRNGDLFSQTTEPGRVQFSEFAQQMMATIYQNWYNSAPQAMQRAMDAGINPFVAASGIVGNNGSVAPAPPSNPSKLPELVGSAASSLGSLGSTFGSVAQGISTLSKLRHEIGKLDAETVSLFEGMGFTKLQSKALSIELQYLNRKEQIGVWQSLANFEKTKNEFQNLSAQHRNIIAQYDEIIAHKDLLIQQEGETKARMLLEDAQKKREDEMTRWQRQENDFFDAHGYRRGDPIYESIRDMMVSDGTFDLYTFGDVVGGYDAKVQGLVEDAKLQAQENHIFAIETARQQGKNLADEIYGRIGSPADLAGRIAKMGTDIAKGVSNGIGNLFKSGKASDIRKDLRMMLDNAYEQLEKYPDDAERLNPLIQQLNAALQLNNKELVEWWKKSNQ